MEVFTEKPIDTKVRETALRIMERAMFYNSTATEQEITGNKPTFFVRFAGHTTTLSVDIHTGGWEPSDRPESFTVRLSEKGYNGTPDEIREKLVFILKCMEKAYTDWYEKEHPNE